MTVDYTAPLPGAVGPIAPSMRPVHIAFWAAHLGFLLCVILGAASGGSGPLAALAAILVFIGLISLLAYFFVLGRYASKMGRSALVWGGLAFIFSPLGVWISYGLAFRLKSGAPVLS